MISSRNALSSLEQALRGIRRDEENLSGVLRNASEELASVRTRQADAFRALARLRLDALKQGEVFGQIDTVEARALELIRQWQKRVDEAIDERNALEMQIERTEDERLEKVDDVDAAIQAIEDLQEATEPEIEADASWQAQRKKLATATSVAKAADEKANNAEADLDDKG
ncbi:MAG: hypothetical protein PVG36_09885, partial [Methyloceanibacter sp.]